MSTWPAPAKINLFLYITNRNSNGYHNLQTLFQFLDYGDTLEIIPDNSGKIKLVTHLDNLSKKDNLIIKAAHALRLAGIKHGTLSSNAGTIISLKKRLPIGGGLGGGSSDAATVLVALNHLWNTLLSEDELVKIGILLGSDVPVFIRGRTAFAEGEYLQPITLKKQWYFVAYPGISILTAELFNVSELTRNSPRRTLEELLRIPFTNDCEKIVRKKFIQIDKLLSSLTKYAPARLTGTGSCVFAEFNTESEAHKIYKIFSKQVKGFVTSGVNISPLQHVLARNIEKRSF